MASAIASMVTLEIIARLCRIHVEELPASTPASATTELVTASTDTREIFAKSLLTLVATSFA